MELTSDRNVPVLSFSSKAAFQAERAPAVRPSPLHRFQTQRGCQAASEPGPGDGRQMLGMKGNKQVCRLKIRHCDSGWGRGTWHQVPSSINQYLCWF